MERVKGKSENRELEVNHSYVRRTTGFPPNYQNVMEQAGIMDWFRSAQQRLQRLTNKC